MGLRMSTAQNQSANPIKYRPQITCPNKLPVKFEFPLAELNAILLEKMQPKSYFRMQQTCRDVYAFIRKSKNITVYMDEYYMVPPWLPHGTSRTSVMIVSRSNLVNPKGLYGIRLDHFYINRGNPFDKICNVLKKYRITCNKVELGYFDLSKKQVQTFLEITKPTEISVPISYTYELLLQSKILKSVEIPLKVDVVDDAIPKFLAKFSKIKLRLADDPPMKLPLLRNILKALLSEYRIHLRYFEFSPVWKITNIPSEEQVQQLFPGFSLKPVTHNYKDNVFEVELPQCFPREATCEITMGKFKGCEIVYKSGPSVDE